MQTGNWTPFFPARKDFESRDEYRAEKLAEKVHLESCAVELRRLAAFLPEDDYRRCAMAIRVAERIEKGEKQSIRDLDFKIRLLRGEIIPVAFIPGAPWDA